MTHYLNLELQAKLKSDDDIWDFLRMSCLDGMWYWDLEQPENEWMSPEFWRLFGYDPATRPHRPESWFEIIHPDDKDLAVENLRRHIEDPAHPYNQIVRYRHAEGHMIWVRCRGLAIRDETGKAIRLLGAHTDLTGFVQDRAAREDQLATANARLSAVVNAVQSGIVGLDSTRRVVTLNPQARNLLAVGEDEAPFAWPRNIRFLDSADLKPLDASSDPINRALAGARLAGETHMMTTGEDTRNARYVRISSARVGAADTDVHTVVALDDISEQEHNRQQIERQNRLDALGQLTGGIAHDFNNLLSTILYAVTLIKEEEMNPRAEKLLNDSLRSIERGRELTRRLLAFGKHDPGTPRSLDLKTVFEGFYDLSASTLEEHIGIDMQAPPAGLSVFCDRSMLENALLNLVLNSRDAVTGTGQGNLITLSAGPADTPDDLALIAADIKPKAGRRLPPFVKISVQDNGPGMTPEVRRRATDPFFSTKTTNSGSGLGLSMVFGFVQQAGGKLRITSRPGCGTTVSMLLPAGSPAERAQTTALREPRNRGRGEMVLLVEDETALLGMMKDQLERMGYQVAAVSSGAAAQQLVQNGLKIDALVSDVVMPGGIGGFELVQNVRALLPHVAVVMLSGYPGQADRESGGMDYAYLHKPCLPDVLDATLREELFNARARE